MKKLRTSLHVGVLLGLSLILLSVSTVFLSSPQETSAVTTVPTKMNFQGRLTDAAGNIKANGNYNMRLKLYTVASGGTSVWSEDRLVSATQGVTVTNGLFSIQLGSITTLPASLFASGTLYLEVELPTPATATSASPVWTEGAMTRNQLATSAYAYNSETLDGQDGDYYLNAGNLTGTLNTSRLSGAYTGITDTGTLVDLAVTGATALNGSVSIGSTADDATFTGFVTNDSGVLKYRTSAQVASDLGAITKNTASNGAVLTAGTWYRVATTSGANGRFGAKVILSNTGGSGTPNQVEFNAVKDWATGASISLISQNGSSCFTDIRIVDDNATATTSYIDVKANGCSSNFVSVLPLDSSFGGTVANGFTTPLGGTEVTRTSLNIANTYSGVSATTSSNDFYRLTTTGIQHAGGYTQSGSTANTFTGATAMNGGLTVASGASIQGNTSIATTAGNTLSIGNTTGALTVSGSSSSNFVIGSNTISAAELILLDGKTGALIDDNDTLGTNFGTINTGDTIDGTVLNASTGFRVAGAAATGSYLRGNGTNFVASTIQAADIPTLNQSTTGSAYYLASNDTRNTNDAPQDFGPLVKYDFKANATNGLSDGGTYNGVMTWRKYGTTTDFSGGPALQMAYSDNGNLWSRISTGATTWGSWNKYWNSANDGASSTLDADLLDGNSSAFFQDAANLTSGTLSSSRLSGSYTGITSVGTLTGLTVGNATTGTITLGDGTITKTSGAGFNFNSLVNGQSGINTGSGNGTTRIDASGNLTNIANITMSGTLGMSTTSPQGALDLGNGTGGRSIVWGGSSGTTHYNSIGSSFSSASLGLVHGLKLDTTADQYLYSYGTQARAGVRIGSFGTGDISLFSAPSSAQTIGGVFDHAANTKLIVKDTGSVGIGTTSPGSYRLNVQGGDVNFSGSLAVGGTVTVSGTALLNSSGYQVLQMNASDYLRINQNNSFTSGTAAYGGWSFGSGGVSIGDWAGASYGTGTLNVTGAIRTSGTIRLDASGNLTNIGTIGSGAITSSGAIVSGTSSGFRNATYVGGYNPIWSFNNATSYGLGYYQVGTDVLGIGQDAIGFHFGNTASPQMYIKADGAIVGANTIQGTRLISTVATGTAPLSVNSTTKVTNLNSDTLDGLDSSAFQLAGSGSSLQSSYTASTGGTTSEIKLDATRGGLDIQDADTTLNTNLLSVRGSNSGGLGSTLFSVASTGDVYTAGEVSRQLQKVTATDATIYSTLSNTYTTLKTFTLTISGDRAVKGIYWSGLSMHSAGGTQYTNIRLVCGKSGEVLGKTSTSENTYSAVGISPTSIPDSCVGYNGNVTLNVQVQEVGSGTAYIDEQEVGVLYTGGLLEVVSYRSNGSSSVLISSTASGTQFTDPQHPDGLVSTPVSNTGNYIVPAGQNLYITAAYNSSGGALTIADGYNIPAGGTVTFGTPLIVGGGVQVNTGGSTSVRFNGYLTEAGVTPVSNTGNYIVPAGQTLYIAAAYNSSASALTIADGYNIPANGTVSFSSPLVVAGGVQVNSGGSTNVRFNGYLTDADGTGGADVAETYFITGGGEPGDIMSIDSGSSASAPAVSKSSGMYDRKMVAVISTKPGLTLGDQTTSGQPGTMAVALNGRVPVKVNGEGGCIETGDPITSSSTPGVGMKATQSGRIVGYALSSYCGSEQGSVIVFINPNYLAHVENGVQDTSGMFSSLNVSGTTTLSILVVTGDAEFKGTITAKDATFNGTLTVNGRMIFKGVKPTITSGTALGISNVKQAAAEIDGTDNAGTVTLTSAGEASATGILAHITFSNAFSTSYKAVLSAVNDNATDLRVYIVKTPTGFDIVTKDAPQAEKQYQFDYILVGTSNDQASAN